MIKTICEVIQQPEDCCGRIGEDFQELTINVLDGGGGAYVALSTERFSLDTEDIDQLCDHLKSLIQNYDKTGGTDV